LTCGARLRGLTVPIREILARKYGSAFGPDDIPHLVAGYEAALRKLGLVDRTGTMPITVAKLIIELAKDGERNPEKLCDRALEILGN
jgi:hypothetical protein